MRRFFAPPEDIGDGLITLSVDETRHLRDVLRLDEGDEVSVFDGLGREFSCRIQTISKKGSVLVILSEIPPAAPESTLDLTLAAAILPGEKFDLVVQKSVELGVVTLQPLYTIRCEARPESGRRRVDRWKKIALEAAKQSGRAQLMEVAEPIQFSRFVIRDKAAENDKETLILFSERGGASFSDVKASNKMTAVIGPKGGWDDSELDEASGSGFAIVTFGGRILRAETAAIALSAILQHRFGDIN